MERAKTYEVKIFIGSKKGYTGDITPEKRVIELCQKYCEKGLGLTVTPTTYVYTGGNEPGYIIGLIQYPRFPREFTTDILIDAFELAHILMLALGQYRCTVMSPDLTYLLENKTLIDSEKTEYG